jgi:simple sugar transport system ATP-binding protein
MQTRVHGSIHLDGRELIRHSVKKRLDYGLGFVPEDRTTDGLVGDFSIAENLMLDRSDRKPFAKGLLLQLATLAKFATEKVKEFDIRTQGIDQKASSLSGGNQQKVVLARELSRELRLLVASQPTRGLDVGSIEFVHEQIVATRDKGLPVMIVATELDEAVALGDRIAVMYRGKIVGIVPADTPRATLGQMMAGVAA